MSLLSQSYKTVKRDVLNPVERNRTRLKSPLSWKPLVPRSCHSSFSSSSLARSAVADDSFRDRICGRGYGSVDKPPLPISGANSQQSLVPTPINPTKTIPRNTPAASSTGKKTGMLHRNFDQSDREEGQASNVWNPICINNVDVSAWNEAYRKCKRKHLFFHYWKQLLHSTCGQSRGLTFCCRLLHVCSNLKSLEY